MEKEKRARRIVDKIVSDLTGRSGMQGDGIDEEAQDEILETWTGLVADEL